MTDKQGTPEAIKGHTIRDAAHQKIIAMYYFFILIINKIFRDSGIWIPLCRILVFAYSGAQ